MTDEIEIDFETVSDQDIKVVGAYRYFESPLTDVRLVSYRIGDGPTRRWRSMDGKPIPDDLAEAVDADAIIWAHNAAFERLAWWHVLTPRYGWPRPGLRQFRCTAATAAALSLPRDLDGASRALAVGLLKDEEGNALMRRMTKPRKVWTLDDPKCPDAAAVAAAPAKYTAIRGGVIEWYGWDRPDLIERQHAYCDQDVAVEAAIRKKAVPLSRDEQEVWWLDQVINDRGIRIDMVSARAALRLAVKARAAVDKEMQAVTGGAVSGATDVGGLVQFANARGVDIPDAKAETLKNALQRWLPDDVRRAIELRREGGKTSVAKIEAMLARACADGRIRGSFLFHAAGTGRWSSLGVQFQNMPRPRKVFEKALETGALTRPGLFHVIRQADPGIAGAVFGKDVGRPLHLLADALRSFLWAGPGRDLLVADYSAIEGRITAWVAGETWKLDAFRAADAGAGAGIYEITAAQIYGVDVAEIGHKDPRRSVGKVSELALGFQGGVAALVSMAANYGMTRESFDALYAGLAESSPPDRLKYVTKRYKECLARGERTTKDLAREGWIAVDLIKTGWRAGHPNIKAFWKDIEAAARNAVQEPGAQFDCGPVSFKVAFGFLFCRLPSGRCLAYGAPKVEMKVVPWADMEEPEEKRERAPCVTVRGVDSVTRQWVRYALYGGLLTENVVQAIARDLLVNGMRKAEAAGYPVIGHVHDEIITEVDRGFGDVAAFERLICELPAWADGLPLTAAGWRGKRYRKD